MRLYYGIKAKSTLQLKLKLRLPRNMALASPLATPTMVSEIALTSGHTRYLIGITPKHEGAKLLILQMGYLRP